MNQAAIFLDRDNTLIEDPGYLADPNQVRLLDGAAAAVRRFNEAGYRVVVVTNQSGVARGLITEDQLRDIHVELQSLLKKEDARIDGIYYCPYLDGPEAIVSEYRRQSDLRKPAPGMLELAARELHLDLEYSWMIGDSLSDVQAGRAAGCHTVLLGNGDLDDSDLPDYRAAGLAEAASIILEDPREDAGQAADPAPAGRDGRDEQPAAEVEAPGVAIVENLDPPAPAAETPRASPQPAAAERPAVDIEAHVNTVRADLQRLAEVLEGVRLLLIRERRDSNQQDFSLAKLGATLFQIVAAAMLLWGIFAMIGQDGSADLIAALARFALAGVVQLMALTLFILDRSTK